MGDACVREMTSKVASIVSLVICNDSMNSTKSLVSLMFGFASYVNLMVLCTYVVD